MANKPKRPKDTDQKAKMIVDLATGEVAEVEPFPSGKNPAAVALGRLGGLVGGKARAKKLTAKKRSQIATNAANIRWNKK